MHEKPRPMEDIGAEALFAHIEIGRQFLYEYEHLILGLSFALAKAARANSNIADVDLISALTALAKSYETLVNSGLHYEVPTAGLQQQSILTELQKIMQEYRQTEQQHLGFARLKDQDVMRGLIFLVRMAHGRTSGRPKSRAFVDFLFSQFQEKAPSGTPPESAQSRLIIP